MDAVDVEEEAPQVTRRGHSGAAFEAGHHHPQLNQGADDVDVVDGRENPNGSPVRGGGREAIRGGRAAMRPAEAGAAAAAVWI